MLKYIFKILLLVLPLFSVGQKKLERQFFIRPGIDLSRLALPYLNDIQVKGFELSLDSEIKYRYFPIIELGITNLSESNEKYEYKSGGNYIRLGLNYNMLNYRQRFDRNLFFIGFRYGTTRFSHESPIIKLSNEWGNYETNIAKTNINTQWFEGVAGIKGEILKNIYMGYTIRVKQIITHSDFNGIIPYWIPGYGKGNKNRVMGMSYSISYAIPIKNPKPEL